jgi:hypothetical protein
MDADTRGALVGDVLMRLVSQVLETVRDQRDRGEPDTGLTAVIDAMGHVVMAQDALDGLYLRGQVAAGLEAEASRLYGLGRRV